MKMLRLLTLVLLAFSTPAFAERLHFDHRLYPPLKAIFDEKRNEMVRYNDSNPKYVVDRIAVQGNSASDWIEAIDIIARSPSDEVKTIDDWFAEIQTKVQAACPSVFETLARDENSITFARRSTGCGKDKVQSALYRIVAGKRSLFMLNAIYRDDMPAEMRAQWLELLKSARLEK